jgi:hypothetical protein
LLDERWPLADIDIKKKRHDWSKNGHIGGRPLLLHRPVAIFAEGVLVKKLAIRGLSRYSSSTWYKVLEQTLHLVDRRGLPKQWLQPLATDSAWKRRSEVGCPCRKDHIGLTVQISMVETLSNCAVQAP